MSSSNLEILAYEPTPLGMLCLRRRELLQQPGTMVTEVTLNHEFLMSSCHTDSERTLAATALEMAAGDNLSVMVGGLGLGYTAGEALKNQRTAGVEVIEFLPQVIGWLDKGLIPLAGTLTGDKRLTVTEDDVYLRLWSPPAKQYDVILIDVDHSPDDRLDTANGRFYTDEGLEHARRHLRPGGILGVWSYAESSPFADAMKSVFGEAEVRPVTFRNTMVDRTDTDWLFFGRRADGGD